MTHDTRTRMIRGTARMVATRGAGSTSLRELAKEAGVPLGSTYYHFPGGKRQLVDEAVRFMGDRIARIIESSREDGVDAAIAAVSGRWQSVLEKSGFHTGCAVLAVATEEDEELRKTATEVFASWEQHLEAVFRDAGVERARAPRLARMVVASLEGAVALCRAERSLQPLEDVAAELRVLIGDAIPAA